VVVIRHARAKRFILRVRGGTINLTIPTTGCAAKALAWAESKAGFIEGELGRAPGAKPLIEGAIYPVLGSERRFVIGGGTPGLDGDCVRAAERYRDDPAPAFERVIRRAVKEAALDDLEGFWSKLGVAPGRLAVRGMKGRWGSCGPDGQTSINWRLAFAPREILRYVAAHEAAHRIEPNHSSRFWKVTERLDPAFSNHDRWLTRHGSQLFAYGALTG
jgi:predicted metal-dependent hydrolase